MTGNGGALRAVLFSSVVSRASSPLTAAMAHQRLVCVRQHLEVPKQLAAMLGADRLTPPIRMVAPCAGSKDYLGVELDAIDGQRDVADSHHRPTMSAILRPRNGKQAIGQCWAQKSSEHSMGKAEWARSILTA